MTSRPCYGARAEDAACDLVLLDPPYDIDPDTVTQVLEVAAGRLTADGLLVLERATRCEFGVTP